MQGWRLRGRCCGSITIVLPVFVMSSIVKPALKADSEVNDQEQLSSYQAMIQGFFGVF